MFAVPCTDCKIGGGAGSTLSCSGRCILARMNKRLLALFTLLTCSFGLQGAAAIQSEASAKPPYEGQHLQLLLGLRAESAPVAAMCAWAGIPAPDWQTESVKGKGMHLTFIDSRLATIYLEMEVSGRGPVWPGELPMDLRRSNKKEDLTTSNNWVGEYDSQGNRSNSNYRTISMNRAFGEDHFSGFEGEVMFSSSGPMRNVLIKVSPEWLWVQYKTAIQEMIPASQFTAEKWLGMLGSDIASETGEILAAWADMKIEGPSCKRAGLALELAENRWIDTITLDPTFKGGFPFGLNAESTASDVSALFGEGTIDADNPDLVRWTLTSAKYWPIHVEFDASDEDLPRLSLRCVRQQVNTFYSLMGAVGKPSESLVADILKLWDVARKNPDPLKGRLEVGQGLFGPVNTWMTLTQLGGVISGTLEETEGVLGEAKCKIEFLLRFYNGDPGQAAKQLDAFAQALKGVLKGTEDPVPYGTDAKESSGLLWSTNSADMFGSAPELRIEARPSEAGSELVLVITAPMPGADK